MINKNIYKYVSLITLLIIILISSVTPTATDSWNLINSAKANLKINDYKLYPGVGVALELLFRGVNSDLSFEVRYVLIAILSSIALIGLVVIILEKYYETSRSTALFIGLLTYLMGPFQLGGLYWDYFYLVPLLILMIVLNEIPTLKIKKNKQLICSIVGGGVVAFLILGKQNSAVLPMLYLIILAVVTGRFTNITSLVVFSGSFIVSLYFMSSEFEIVNIPMISDHLRIPFRYSLETTEGSIEGVYRRIIYRIIPLVYSYHFSIKSIAFNTYAIFQTQIFILLTTLTILQLSRGELRISSILRAPRSFINYSFLGIFIIYFITVGRNWNEIYPLGPLIIFLLIKTNSLLYISSKITKLFLFTTIIFIMGCIAVPVKNYLKIFNNDYDRPYGLIIFGAYATGSYIHPKEAMQILKTKSCVGGIGNDISPLLYLGSKYCSHLIQVEQSVKSRDISYVSILKTMKINNAIFINSCIKTESCYIAQHFKEYNLIDFIGSAKLIYNSGNIDFYITNE